ncbi:hypothetical protein LHFGNBLO_001338 [Mesorhizobium sp. AR10]|uniref:hypothetical protein n=1 Tax=Mesorhizobium sp. AR10 TaxID=2865839 RepID=UPI00215E1D39|nr:hypothetical protein [Mesorhizobium sp. AR10]UVK39923.1 hypothetical protein LHFGNBLO_001338 [Mesorhizobium sp. AR10]
MDRETFRFQRRYIAGNVQVALDRYRLHCVTFPSAVSESVLPRLMAPSAERWLVTLKPKPLGRSSTPGRVPERASATIEPIARHSAR